jgi:hypothetical protein
MCHRNKHRRIEAPNSAGHKGNHKSNVGCTSQASVFLLICRRLLLVLACCDSYNRLSLLSYFAQACCVPSSLHCITGKGKGVCLPIGVLCYVMLCYVMLCYVMLCYVRLCSVIQEPAMEAVIHTCVLFGAHFAFWHGLFCNVCAPVIVIVVIIQDSTSSPVLLPHHVAKIAI